MRVLDNIKPEAVFYYFEEICNIPHGSSNTDKISNYLVKFAEDRGLKYEKDKLGNVIIFKPGTAGYEKSPAVIIQGHMDMVCEKTSDCDIDFLHEGIKLKLDGNVISADNTTLGGDDGIAVAYALALLDASEEDIVHPPLEVVITVDEEIGMLGAAYMDCSSLSGRNFLNIDSEEEGQLLVSCAGGATACCSIPVSYEDFVAGNIIKISITGVTGGHSGTEIIKEGANASKVLGRILYSIYKKYPVRLINVTGGMKDNAIPREAAAVLVCEKDIEREIIEEYNNILKSEYMSTDPDICVDMTAVSDLKSEKCMTQDSTKNVIVALLNVPNGIVKMSKDISGLVQTSLNLGILKTVKDGDNNSVVMSFSVRSSVGTEKEELILRLEAFMELFGGELSVEGDYPAWEYKKDSKLRELMVSVYKEMYDKEPAIEAIHAGLECGLFAGKLSGLDCVSFGPQIDDIHTPDECLYVDSVYRTWNYLLEILKRLK